MPVDLFFIYVIIVLSNERREKQDERNGRKGNSESV